MLRCVVRKKSDSEATIIVTRAALTCYDIVHGDPHIGRGRYGEGK